MPDLRAMILDRLEVLLGSIEGAPSEATYRNRGALKAERRPCTVLLDGRETVHQSFEGRSGRIYARNSPYVMILQPEIYALLLARPLARADEYTAELNQYRNAILTAVLTDQEILDLTGENGDVAYRGSETDMQSGRPMEGVLRVDFAFYYVLNPSAI